MTRHHKLFTALVLHGALLSGCFEEEEGEASTDDTTTDDTTGTDSATPSDSGDTGTPAACAEAECLATEAWDTCTADGVQCCWATGECCDPCCGHLSP
ncbi:MAG: hypothetical protein EP330_17575 [Deltaproteobacteria bacterium]|nr:MAG: hypothetical protein EP330_17575 [Deltaproteobacteria bacterium]